MRLHRLPSLLLAAALLALWGTGTPLWALPTESEWSAAAARQPANPWAEPTHPPALRSEVRQNFYDDGTLRTQWQVRIEADGSVVRHGRLLRYHPNGRISLRGQYRDGRPSGIWSWFDGQGRLLRKTVPQGDYEEIVSGRGLENPATVYRDPEGRKLAEGLRKHDKPHGPWTYYHPGGAVRAQGTYVNGLPDGRWVFYHPTGQIERLEEYKLGVPHGIVLRGYPNGQERLKGRVEQGLRVDLWRTWHANGQIESEGRYREDRREGEWRFWDVNGRLVGHVRYAAGQIVEELPLPVPGVEGPRIVTDPELLPFRPRIYDDTGTQIKLAPH